jgi:NADPH-dependent glutamate synthase beta subunit-like oxidoreductase/Pyruvate/2-oxoacid:ferredoxin oxidoreductase delta subunit
MAIGKTGKAPCASTCPAGIHVQGYVALIAQGRFREAINLIREAMPFPSVCGRVCNHYCEMNCTRGRVDESVNIMALKRFVADWEYSHRSELGSSKPATVEKTGSSQQRIAVIGSGPAGLTAARDLNRLGYAVTVFEALPIPGGMMRVGIPPHRLPAEMLDWEIQQILDEGIELKLNTWVDDIPGLLAGGYSAVLIATGAHQAKKLSLRDSNHPDNWLSLDVLRKACLGKKLDLNGRHVVVLGGGNVALDVSRTVLRLGAQEVRMACLEPRGEMPGFAWEINVAEQEGIEMYPGRNFKEIIVKRDKIVGVKCAQVNFRGFTGGRPDFDEIAGSEHILPADLVIWAIGQGPNFSFLPQDGSINTRFPVGIQSDANMMTTLPGVFVAGDVHRGVTFFVVDAIGEGHRAARSIDRYLRGSQGVQEVVPPPVVTLMDHEVKSRLKQRKNARLKRVQITSIPLQDRIHNFREVDLTISEEQAITEANRCLVCGPCSECLACIEVCQPGAILHHQQGADTEVDVAAILYAGAPDAFPVDSLAATTIVHHIPPDDPFTASAVSAKVLGELEASHIPALVASSPNLTSAPARIGVFICQCGDEIARTVDMQDVLRNISTLPDVIHSQVLPFSCSQEASQTISSAIHEHRLDRAVLAACSCCAVNQVCFSCTYQRVRCKQNIGLFTRPVEGGMNLSYAAQEARFEFVNIREQCAWIHVDDPQAATEKATSLVAATIARVRAAPIKLAGTRHIERSVMILGNGAASTACQKALLRQDITVQMDGNIPGEIQRTGGQYVVTGGHESWKASAIVLAPRNRREHERLLAAFGRERRRPQTYEVWGGLETTRPGVFFCRPGQDTNLAGEAVSARVNAWLGRIASRPPLAAIVDPERCRACKTCVETCEYCAPELVEVGGGRRAAWIDPAICRGCGTCAVHCPSGAISAGCSTDAQVQAMLRAILVESPQ